MLPIDPSTGVRADPDAVLEHGHVVVQSGEVTDVAVFSPFHLPQGYLGSAPSRQLPKAKWEMFS